MKRLIEKFIKKRSPGFCFDESLGIGIILHFAFNQFAGLLRGCLLLLRLRSPKRMIRGKAVKVFNLSMIRWGHYLKLGDYVLLSAVSKKGITLGNNVGIGAFGRLVVATSFNQAGEYINIGNNVGIGEFAYLGGAGGLSIGDDCIVGQYFSCHPENHLSNDIKIPIRLQGVSRQGITIGNNCWIGSKVTILDGVNLGDGCVIAAGAVVTKSFPENSMIGGVPAKLIKKRGKKTLFELMDLEYELSNG